MARPYLRRLMEEGGETANLYLEQDGEAICMAQVECRQMMRAIARPGGRVQMHCSGAGKAMLGWVADARADADHPAARPAPGHRADAGHADASCARRSSWCASAGYAVDDEEHAVGLRCVAAPVFDEHGQPVAALSLSGPGARVTETRLSALGELTARSPRSFRPSSAAIRRSPHPTRDLDK